MQSTESGIRPRPAQFSGRLRQALRGGVAEARHHGCRRENL